MSENKFQLLNINDYELGETIKVLSLGKMKIARNKKNKELILIKVLKKIQFWNQSKPLIFSMK